MHTDQITETTDPLAALIAAHVPALRAPRLVRVPSLAAEVDWVQRQGRPGFGTGNDFPRGLIPVHGIRYGERY